MRRFQIVYTETARNCIRHLPPIVKSGIKALIEKLSEDPYAGKELREELAGFWSCRFQRWRVIYIIEENKRKIEILLVEKRISVYETLKEMSH